MAKTRTIDGYTFITERSFKTKAEARGYARELRKRYKFVRGVRIIKGKSGYEVYWRE